LLFANENPLGRHFRIGEAHDGNPWITIVGVAGNERDRNFFREMKWEEIPTVFLPMDQQPTASCALVLHTNHVAGVAGIIEKDVRRFDPNVAVGEVETMDDRVAHVLAYPRFRATVLAIFAGMAVLLAAVGLYGVLAQSTAQRTQEFGVRMALGARRRDVLGLVIRQGMLVACAGLVVGLVLARAITTLLAGLLYGVRASDPWLWLAVSGALLAVAFAATFLPAWRAARVDPATSLRYE